MRLEPVEPARRFRVGRDGSIELTHVADVELDADEQITFRAATGSAYDVVRKSWGYYATPSLNRRLPDHRLHAMLCAGSDGRTSLLLVERDERAAFEAYLADQGMVVTAPLDGDPCPMCRVGVLRPQFSYAEPPDGETRFDLKGEDYHHEILRCLLCGHFVGRTNLDVAALYEADYMNAQYSGDRLSTTYERIMGLPSDRSDNVGRVARIVDRLGDAGAVLDIGSGLGVFPARMLEAGWTPTALDPDERAVRHARERIGVAAIQADFVREEVSHLGRFDLVTFNKVLEHVPEPEVMLSRAREVLAPSGEVYIELPDGEAACVLGPDREEFFIEHLHVFSMASLALLASRAGFSVARAERLREPSDKFTLVAFLT